MGASVGAPFKPTQRAGIFYNAAPAIPVEWRNQNSLFIVGRVPTNGGTAAAVAAGAFGAIYIDLALNTTVGTYHALLYQANSLGPAIGNMGGGTGYGPATDILTNTSAVISKYEAVLRRMRLDNSWMNAVFHDDSGPDWAGYSSFNSGQRESIYLAWVAIMARVRAVADELGFLSICNGGWFGTNAAPNNNHGYPVRGTHGCSYFDVWTTEGPAGHTWAAQGAFWSAVHAGQWRLIDTVGRRGAFYISPSSSETALWAQNEVNTGWIAEQTVYDSATSLPPPVLTPHNLLVSFSGSTPTVTVTVAPPTADVQEGTTKQFTATVSDGSAVTWYVNNIAGGNATVGTISASGLYTCPATVVDGTQVVVKAQNGAGVNGTALVTQRDVVVTPGPTPPAFPSVAPFSSDGNTFVGTTPNGGMGADTNRGCTITFDQRGRIESVMALIDGLVPSAVGSQAFRYLVYADDGAGAPGALLYTTADGSVAAGAQPAWIELAQTGTTDVVVEPGTVLHLHIHSGTNIVGRYWYTPSTGVSRSAADVFVGGPIDPFAGGSVTDADISIAIKFTPLGVSAATWRDGTVEGRPANQIEGDGPIRRRNIVAPAGGFANLTARDSFRNVVIDASNLTPGTTLFNAYDVFNPRLENLLIEGLPSDCRFAQFTNCDNPIVEGIRGHGGYKGVSFDACDDPVAGDLEFYFTDDGVPADTGYGVLIYNNVADHLRGTIQNVKVVGNGNVHILYGWGSDSATLAGPTHASDLLIGDISGSGFIGGVWFSKVRDLHVGDIRLRDGSDVGIDFEGCIDCSATGFAIRNVVAGALSALYNSKGIRFSGGSVTSDLTTLLGTGKLASTSSLFAFIRDTCEDITIEGVTFTSRGASRTGEINVWKNAESLGPARVKIAGCEGLNWCVNVLDLSDHVTIDDNGFYFDFDFSAAAGGGVVINKGSNPSITRNRAYASADSSKIADPDYAFIVVDQGGGAAGARQVKGASIHRNKVQGMAGVYASTKTGSNPDGGSYSIRDNEVMTVKHSSTTATSSDVASNRLPTTFGAVTPTTF